MNLKASTRWDQISHDRAAATLSMTPDGEAVLAVDPLGKLTVWRGDPAKPRAVSLDLPVRLAEVAPDGKTAVAAFTDPDERLARVDLATGRLLGRLEHRSLGVAGLAVSPDGASCLVTSEDETVWVYSLATGKLLRAFDPEEDGLAPPAAVFGPEGRHVYLTGPGGASRHALAGGPREVGYTLPAEGRSKWRPPVATCLAVSADEAAVAVGGSRGEVWVFAAGTGKLLQEVKLSGRIRALAFSTSGRVLAVAEDDGRAVCLVPLKP